MFTIKYRYYEPAPTPSDATTAGFSPCERIDGPYQSVSQRYEGGFLVVTADNGNDTPSMTYGPISNPPNADTNFPRPTAWVMNDRGATVATYQF